MPNVNDPIKALRALLKAALRRFGFRAVSVEEQDELGLGDDKMKLSKYAGESYLKPEDFENGPEVKTIKSVAEGRYHKPDATFTDHTKLSLNSTNVKALLKIFGDEIEGDALVGQRIELYKGRIKYDGRDQDAVRVRAVGSGPAPMPPAPPGDPDNLSDEPIPF
jgi:hypothetical protein